MTIDEAARTYSRLSADAQVRFLALFAHNLTVAARETYEFQASGVRSPERLRAINEIQHRVLPHIHSLLSQSECRYPDDVLTAIMLRHDDPLLRDQAAWAFEDALKKTEGSTDA